MIRRGDGSLIHIAVSPFPMQLARKVAANQWTNALKVFISKCIKVSENLQNYT